VPTISPRSIAFCPKYGTAKKPRDFVSFQGWAKGFLTFHGLGCTRRCIIDNQTSPAAQRAATLQALRDSAKIPQGDAPAVVAWVCHGQSRKIQLGWSTANIATLAKTLATAYGPKVRVVLYCCLAGGGPNPTGDGDFADRLRDALCCTGVTECEVTAHITAGRADYNPYCRRFDGAGSSTGGDGGYWLVNKTLLDAKGRKYPNPMWPKWVAALKKNMRWRMPILAQKEIWHELASA